MIQSLPSDRQVLVTMEQGNGLAIFIVWAHNVCGLNVLVKQPEDFMYDNEGVKETFFGSGAAQVIIEYGLHYANYSGSTVTLMDVVNDAKLFVFSTEEDEPAIDAIVKRPAKGIGRRWLEKHWESSIGEYTEGQVGKEAAISEVMNISVAFAQLLASKFVMTRVTNAESGFSNDQQRKPSQQDFPDSINEERKGCPKYLISSSRIQEAARFIFGERKITEKMVKPYELMYSEMPLSEVPAPKCICIMSENLGFSTDFWDVSLLLTAQNLSAVILAFAHVMDLEAAGELPLTDRSDLLDDNDFLKNVRVWDGKSQLLIHDSQWYEILVALTVGQSIQNDSSPLERTCLVSDRGWSVFLSNFSTADPSLIGALTCIF
jgi:hypothetical protein